MVAEEKKRVFITLELSLLDKLEDLSWQERMTKSEYVAKLILEEMNKKGQKQ